MRLGGLIRLFVTADDKSLFENDLQLHLGNLAVVRNQVNSFANALLLEEHALVNCIMV